MKEEYFFNADHQEVRLVDKNGKYLCQDRDGSIQALLLFAILEKLEEIKCGIIDVENEIGR